MKNPSPKVMALGFFDGIHIGHGALMERSKAVAESLGAECAVLTFDIHPDTFVKGSAVELINSAADRRYILKRFFDIDNVYFVHFNERTMRMYWKDFIDNVIETYNAVHFVVGHDFCFGYKGEGKADVLKAYCESIGLGCDIISPVMRDGEVVSSTLIRNLLSEGKTEKANEYLGHPHILTDTVRSGFRIGGTTLGAPTINMVFGEGVLVPRCGVYATKTVLPEGEYTSVTNVGIRPTFGGNEVTVETNIFDFSGYLYGTNVCVEFHSFIRPERKFSSPEALMSQIKDDCQSAKDYFEK